MFLKNPVDEKQVEAELIMILKEEKECQIIAHDAEAEIALSALKKGNLGSCRC